MDEEVEKTYERSLQDFARMNDDELLNVLVPLWLDSCVEDPGTCKLCARNRAFMVELKARLKVRREIIEIEVPELFDKIDEITTSFNDDLRVASQNIGGIGFLATKFQMIMKLFRTLDEHQKKWLLRMKRGNAK